MHEKMASFREKGGSLILVSYAMHNVKNLCDRAIWLEKGVFRESGDSVQVADNFEHFMLSKKDDTNGEVINMDKDAEIISFKFDDQIEQGQEVSLKLKLILRE